MKPRILFAGLFHETHTFVDGTTGWNNFLVSRGDEILAKKGDASPTDGFLTTADELGIRQASTLIDELKSDEPAASPANGNGAYAVNGGAR